MLVAVFCTRVRPELIEEYEVELERIWNFAKDQPGFISSKSYFSDDGEKVSIQEWESPEHLRAWRNHPEHAEAQKRGRDEFYQNLKVYICDKPRTYGFSR